MPFNWTSSQRERKDYENTFGHSCNFICNLSVFGWGRKLLSQNGVLALARRRPSFDCDLPVISHEAVDRNVHHFYPLLNHTYQMRCVKHYSFGEKSEWREVAEASRDARYWICRPNRSQVFTQLLDHDRHLVTTDAKSNWVIVPTYLLS